MPTSSPRTASAAAGFSEAAQANIFEKTAAKVYRLG